MQHHLRPSRILLTLSSVDFLHGPPRGSWRRLLCTATHIHSTAAMIVAHSANDDPAGGLPLRRIRTAITQRIDHNCARSLLYTILAHASPYGMSTIRRAERATQLPLRAQNGLLSSVNTSLTAQSVPRIVFFFRQAYKRQRAWGVHGWRLSAFIFLASK